MYWVVYKLIGYRKRVVQENLRKAFPNFAKTELEALEASFYSYLFDLMVENIKSFSANTQFWLGHVQITGLDVLLTTAKKQNALLVLPHYGNWEWSGVFGHLLKQQGVETYVIYQPIKNSFLNKKMYETRLSLGVKLMSTKEVKENMETLHNGSQPFVVALIADQSPGSAYNSYWTHFLNQETAFAFGPEYFSKKYNIPLVLAHIRRPKRGFYELHFSSLVQQEQIQSLEHGAITEMMVQAFERIILEDPSFWLWSHKRWKDKKEKN